MTHGACPSCGAPVEFTAGSAQVVVCGFCQTVVARKGVNLEAHGKIAAIVETGSPLRLGLEGRLGKTTYRLVGHLQKDHGAGPWDEWYVEFSDGRTGWLSEAEGAFYLLFAEGDAPGLKLSALGPGKRFSLRGHRLAVEERGHGRVVAAAGQLPSDVDPSADGHYVDATGQGGVFATLDFGQREETPEVFIGRRLKLEELGIPKDQLQRRSKKVALQDARCTQCNGALELRAPDSTKRVSCPFCGALLDVRKGKLTFLQLLEKPEHPPLIPLGTKGKLNGVEWTCIGFMVRSCNVEGVRYPWGEYLLFNWQRGFTWLMESDGHWVYLTPLDVGEVSVASGSAAHLEGQRYKAFQKVNAVTETVLGEFYWQVRAGDVAEAEEYVAPPYSVSADITYEEVTYTKGEYLEPKAVQEAFRLKEALPPPTGIAPSQPNPHRERNRKSWQWTAVWAAALVLAFVGVNLRATNQRVLDQTVRIAPDATPGTPAAMSFSQPFTTQKLGNLRVRLEAPVDNDWLGIQGDLVNEDTGEVTSFYEEMGYYHGQASDGAWSEGSQAATAWLSAVEPGRYMLRTTASFEPKPRPGGFRAPSVAAYGVTVTSDVPRWNGFLLALLALLLGPILGSLRSSSFETRRWSQSNLGSND